WRLGSACLLGPSRRRGGGGGGRRRWPAPPTRPATRRGRDVPRFGVGDDSPPEPPPTEAERGVGIDRRLGVRGAGGDPRSGSTSPRRFPPSLTTRRVGGSRP